MSVFPPITSRIKTMTKCFVADVILLVTAIVLKQEPKDAWDVEMVGEWIRQEDVWMSTNVLPKDCRVKETSFV